MDLSLSVAAADPVSAKLSSTPVKMAIRCSPAVSYTLWAQMLAKGLKSFPSSGVTSLQTSLHPKNFRCSLPTIQLLPFANPALQDHSPK
mmetsp:Transcript_54773/g.66029  ORF Transcript_54773/g.66029 Transcript_54773/m.66029 type:complete len:89 (-) Transcript_54773:3016-3282(-)